uniref:M50 family metallopeptidase n=1 Tax=Leucobacter soli TaxID=2812850 RepID=UPI0038B2ACFB
MLLYLLGILIIVLGLALSIGLHEIGHLLPAKLFGVKVTQYMIGFGRTLWSKRKGETEYGVKLIPLGGYVAMTGMYPPAKPGETPRASTTGFLNTVMQEGAAVPHAQGGPDATENRGTGTALVVEAATEPGPEAATGPDTESPRGLAGMVHEARQASAETIGAGEDARTFYRLAVWKKIVIMLGGPFMNLVLAVVFFGIVLVGFGIPQYSTTLSQVSECLIPASSDATACTDDATPAPGAAAGLLPGDRITAIDGTRITDWEQIRDIVSAAPGEQLAVTIERHGSDGAVSVQTLAITPAENQRAVTDENGVIVRGDDGEPEIETVGMIGVSPGSEVVQQPVTAVPAFVGENVQQVAGVIIGLPQRMVDVWNAAFGAEERDPNGPMSVVGVGRMAGEIVSMDQAPVAAKAQTMFGLLGSLNVALFVFNLVPLMPLDGGHIAGAIYEGAKRGWARIRRKPDPGPIDTAKMVPVTFVVVIVLGAMSLLLMYADIVKPIDLFG